ncbi:MAG TPA: DUF808 family protein, partial [Novosphingobium sp.]|nr:DUF808 family protein [Novosphingobium sp.]
VHRGRTRAGQAGGRMILKAMPKLLSGLSGVGTVAMLWVGGGILIHGSHELGWHGPSDLAHGVEHAVAGATGVLGGVLGWISYAAFVHRLKPAA